MVDQWILKILVAPLALLYGIGVAFRNALYSAGLLRGVSFSIPVISVGNLSVGGTGKTPHTEYLARLLHEYLKTGIVSRGYRRKSTGYIEVSMLHDATMVGDEPMQLKRKFPHLPVAVAESRGLAIPQLIRTYPDIQVILMDDGFQHREVNPGLNILLTAFDELYTRDWLLPVGKLREWGSAASRADIIIVTKCPDQLDDTQMEAITKEVRTDEDQFVFFTRYIYGNPYRMYQSGERVTLSPDLNVLLVTGLAGSDYLMNYVSANANDVSLLEYRDHHPFSPEDIADIKSQFAMMEKSGRSILLTTEKDAMRLDVHRELIQKMGIPVYILPLAVQFIGHDPQQFDHTVKEWLLNFKR